MRLTPLAVSVLGLLVERPMHPYEMLGLLRERHEDQIVKVSAGSLYHSVERLTCGGLADVIGTDRAGKRPERTTYAITPAGDQALKEALGQMLDAPVNEYPQFPLALSEAHNLPPEQVVLTLSSRLDQLDEQIVDVEGVLGSVRQADVPEAYWFVADYLRTMRTAERDWIRALVHRLQNEELTWPPASKS